MENSKQNAQHTPRAQMDLLMANRPQTIEDVDQWLTNYLAAGEAAREIEKATERLHDAAPDLLQKAIALLDRLSADACAEYGLWDEYIALQEACNKATGGAQ